MSPHHAEGGFTEIPHRRAFPQELRAVVDGHQPGIEQRLEEVVHHRAGAPGQHGAAEDDGVRPVLFLDGVHQLLGDLPHEVQIQPPGLQRRRAHTDNRDLRFRDGLRHIRGGPQPPALPGSLHQRIQTGFDNRRFPGIKGIHLGLLHIGSDDSMTFVRKTGCGDGADISESKDANLHSAVKCSRPPSRDHSRVQTLFMFNSPTTSITWQSSKLP